MLVNSLFTHQALVERLSKYKTVDDWKNTTKGDITSTGWVVDTIEVALWGFFRYNSWEQGVLRVVNLGGNSDTAGAIYGALAGVFYGYEAIPKKWVEEIQNAALIQEVTDAFAQLVN